MHKTLNKSETKALEAQLAPLGFALDKKDRVVLVDNAYLSINGRLAFFQAQGRWAPTLRLLLERPLLPVISVDRGAIPFLLKGADVMRPGVVDWDANVFKGGLITVVDQEHRKPLAVAAALVDASELAALEKGRVAKTLHYVGDEIWSRG